MGKKRHQPTARSTSWVPTVGSGAIQKKSHPKSQQQSAPSFVFRGYQPPIPMRVTVHNPSAIPPPSISNHQAILRPPFPPHHFPPLPPTLPPPTHLLLPRIPPSFPPPSISIPAYGRPPSQFPPIRVTATFSTPSTGAAPPPAPVGLVTTPVLAGGGRKKTPPTQKSPVKKSKQQQLLQQQQQQTPAAASSNRSEVMAKKAQLKYARQLAATKKQNSISQPVVKTEPEAAAPTFNIFMNIANRYRTTMPSPDAIEIQDDTEDEEEHIEEIEETTPNEQQRAAVDTNMTIVENMSICTVDEVGDETIQAIEEREEEGGRGEEGGVEDDDDEIVCLGEQKGNHVFSEVVILDDDDDVVEVEEVDVFNEAMAETPTGASKSSSTSVMERSIVGLTLDDGKEKKKDTVAVNVAQLPEFIPLLDGKGKKKAKQQAARPVQPVNQQPRDQPQLQPIVMPSQTPFPWIGAPIATPIVMMTRQKEKKEKRRREKGRKRAEMRAMEVGASPSSIARSVAASTCTLNPLAFATPSKIPLPAAAPPPSPLAHFFRFPPGSGPHSSSLLHPHSTSAMGMIQSRGLATSRPHSQPVNIPGMPHSGMVGGGGAPTLAALLNDEATGVVRDSLTASGCYRRQWETDDRVSRPDIKVDPSAAPFRICSYNVLCQKTIGATDYLYKHARFQPEVLEWAHRWPLIQRELNELNADVFGLQEIQDVHFEQYYEPFLKSLGYVCLFQKKSETQHADGLGVFVKANRFKIMAMNSVDFLIRGDKLLDRGNVAQLLRLECLQTGASLIVSNTHILFNEKRGDVKLAQIALLMANIHAMRTADEPVICLGDWNLEPASDLYNYITNGSLDASTFVPRYGSGQLREGRNFSVPPMREMPMDTHLKTGMSRDGVLYENEGALLQSLRSSNPSIFSHQIPLASTYAPYRERRVSTYHKDIANPDFIFYTTAGRGEHESSRLRLIRRLSMPPEASIRQHLEPWPNHYVPSDHIPLMAEFYLSK